MARSALFFAAFVLFFSFVAAQCTESDFDGKWKFSFSHTASNVTYSTSETYSLSSDNSYTASGTLTITTTNGTTTCDGSSSGTWTFVNATQNSTSYINFNVSECSPTTATGSGATMCPACSVSKFAFNVQSSNCTLYLPGPAPYIYLTKGGVAPWVVAIIIVGVVLVVGVVVGMVVYRRYKHHQRHIYETA